MYRRTKKYEEKKILINLDDILEIIADDYYIKCCICEKKYHTKHLLLNYDNQINIVCKNCHKQNYFS